MTIIIHVLIALASIAMASYACIQPTQIKLRATYILAASTLMTGFYLVLTMPAHMLQACTSGVIYLSVMIAAIAIARKRFTRMQTVHVDVSDR